METLMSTVFTPEQLSFVDAHRWGVLATARAGGAPQQSMVGYTVDAQGRIVVSTKSYTAKWRNVVRNRNVSFTVVDGHTHLVVDGEAEPIQDDPERAELSADVFAKLADAERPDPASLVKTLDEQQRTIIRVTPRKALLHE
jgi:PPOX class probable F420-dependent enzyme